MRRNWRERIKENSVKVERDEENIKGKEGAKTREREGGPLDCAWVGGCPQQLTSLSLSSSFLQKLPFSSLLSVHFLFSLAPYIIFYSFIFWYNFLSFFPSLKRLLPLFILFYMKTYPTFFKNIFL